MTLKLGRDNNQKITITKEGISIDFRTIPLTNNYYKILNDYALRQDTSETCDNVFTASNEDDVLFNVCKNHVGE